MTSVIDVVEKLRLDLKESKPIHLTREEAEAIVSYFDNIDEFKDIMS